MNNYSIIRYTDDDEEKDDLYHSTDEFLVMNVLEMCVNRFLEGKTVFK